MFEICRAIPMPDDHIINLQELFPADKIESLLDDFAHPNDAGYQLIAKKVYDTVIKDPDNHNELKDSINKIGQ